MLTSRNGGNPSKYALNAVVLSAFAITASLPPFVQVSWIVCSLSPATRPSSV